MVAINQKACDMIKTTDISNAASPATIIFESLRNAIIEGDLKDGEPLRQDALAKMFNTSRIPVREALTRLEEYGLIHTQRYKGAVVASLSADEAAEIFDFRCLLEPAVMRSAVPRMTPATLAAARQHAQAFQASNDPTIWGVENRAFHRTLYQASGLRYHLGIVANTFDRVDRYLRAQLTPGASVRRADDEHQEILKACAAGKADHAAALTLAHISGVREQLLDKLTP